MADGVEEPDVPLLFVGPNHEHMGTKTLLLVWVKLRCRGAKVAVTGRRGHRAGRKPLAPGKNPLSIGDGLLPLKSERRNRRPGQRFNELAFARVQSFLCDDSSFLVVSLIVIAVATDAADALSRVSLSTQNRTNSIGSRTTSHCRRGDGNVVEFLFVGGGQGRLVAVRGG